MPREIIDWDNIIDNLDEEYTIEPVQTLAVKVEEVAHFEKKVDNNKDEPSMDDLLK